MTDIRPTNEALEAYIKAGLGEDAASVELDLLALATCFDKKDAEHAAHAKVAKKVLKKHASEPVAEALALVSRRNYFPTAKTTNHAVVYKFKVLEDKFEGDFAALTELEGFDELGYFGRLGALHPQVARHLLDRADLDLFRAYFERGHRGDTLTEDHFIEANGRYRWEDVYSYSREELEVLASMGRFTTIELRFEGDAYLLPDDLSAWEDLESLSIVSARGAYINGPGVASLTQAQVDALGALPKLRELTLRLSMKELPGDLSPLAGLTMLDLSSNELSELPDSLDALQSLERLILSGNAFERFPEPVTRLVGLRELNMGKNWKCADIPDSIGEMKGLERLYVWAMGVESCSERLGELENLKELNASGFKETAGLFAALGKLKGLESLYLANFEGLKRLPDAIGELTNLKKLTIDGMDDLEEWFDGLGNLTELVELRLERIAWGSGMASLPEGIGKLKDLEVLSFDRTGLKGQFPKDVVKCKKLRELDLGTCRIGSPPKNIGDLTELEVLDLGGMRITAYPESLFTLKKLKKLDMSGGSVPNLPDAVRGLESLEHLSVTWSKVTALPDAIVELENLRHLGVGVGAPRQSAPVDLGRHAESDL